MNDSIIINKRRLVIPTFKTKEFSVGKLSDLHSSCILYLSYYPTFQQIFLALFRNVEQLKITHQLIRHVKAVFADT